MQREEERCREEEGEKKEKKVEKYEMREVKERSKRRDRQIEKEGKTKIEGEGILWYCSETGKIQAVGRAKEKGEIESEKQEKEG